ncbi:MAG: glycerophosphoryl diester phosphodiesterase [Thermoleophilaceae bacterium]|jgi:glycerophosphoryl diester phosphodiesterase|nr:glycerophosphoryl diester phosphodiesterase [Thermoleophilaceae bacterium]MEA2407508.1 glycerophosphoryl diester phosphodiesterase [Thermoleophilaceae bacterium]
MKTRVWLLLLLSILVMGALIAPLAEAKRKHKQHAPKEQSPLVIGHRGATGYLPEHTLQSYALAIKLGADYIEPDLVVTKDGVLIARHEPDITATTNVADHPEFASRKTTKTVDGVPTEGWFASDFTLREIKTLGAKQTRAGRPTEFDGRFKIPTLQEVINLAKRESKRRGRTIGIYPETKHPTFHQGLGLPLEGRLVRVLKRNGLNRKNSPVFIQSFEQSNLKQLNRMTRVRLVQLVDANDTDANGDPTYAPPYDRPYDWTVSGDAGLMARTFGYFATDDGLAEIKTYADGIGPWKVYIVGTDPAGNIKKTTDLIQRAHAHKLLIHTWTFRNDAMPSDPSYQGNPIFEYLKFYEMGIDGVFSDFPDTAFAARELFRLR